MQATMSSGLQKEHEDHLRALKERISKVKTLPQRLPEPAMKLDLAKRANDRVRQFKHLHQMCH